MKAAFTICSNNYLAQAKVLTDSISNFSSDYDVYIILCDKKSNLIDYSYLNCKIIEVENINIENFNWMIKRYNIVELNTAIKPFVLKHFLDMDYETVYYFDPDIKLYNSLDIIDRELGHNNFLLTPHSFSPLELDGNNPDDTTFLNYGIYNLGFCGARKSLETYNILKWWSSILKQNCFIIPMLGLFVDQLPMNLAPLYFKNVKIALNKGLNVSWWNLHERSLLIKDGKFVLNNGDDLCFFHFSNYKLSSPNEISIPQRYSRGKLIPNSPIDSLYKDYQNSLSEACKYFGNNIECFYGNTTFTDKIRFKIKGKLTHYLYSLANILKRI